MKLTFTPGSSAWPQRLRSPAAARRRSRLRPPTAAGAGRRPGRGKGRQRLQLVRLHRRGRCWRLREGNRHQGQLRRVRQQRGARDQAARRQLRLRRGGAVRPRSSSGRSRPACSRSSTSPSCRTGRTWTRTSCSAWRAMTRATSTRSTTCGAPTRIGYNVKKVQAIGPEGAGRQLGAGVRARTGPRSSRTAASRSSTRRTRSWPSRSPTSARTRTARSPDDLKKAEDLLMKIRPYVRSFNPREYINDLANGEICVVDRLERRHPAGARRGRGGQAGRRDRPTRFPRKARSSGSTCCAIPADAPHPTNAHAFINFMMKPEVAAANSNFVYYANGNEASLPLIDPAVRDDPGVYPPPEDDGEAVPEPRPVAGLHARAEPQLDAVHDRQVGLRMDGAGPSERCLAASLDPDCTPLPWL